MSYFPNFVEYSPQCWNSPQSNSYVSQTIIVMFHVSCAPATLTTGWLIVSSSSVVTVPKYTTNQIFHTHTWKNIYRSEMFRNQHTQYSITFIFIKLFYWLVSFSVLNKVWVAFLMLWWSCEDFLNLLEQILWWFYITQLIRFFKVRESYNKKRLQDHSLKKNLEFSFYFWMNQTILFQKKTPKIW